MLRALATSLVDAYPWLADVLEVLSYLNEIWHQYQSIAILVGLFIVWNRLRRERIKLGERVDTLVQIVRAARDEAEAALAQPQTIQPGPETAAQQDHQANWDAVRSIWRDARDRLELAIESIGRSNVRGKYSKLSRYTYRDVINSLEADGAISPTVSSSLLMMDTKFNTFKFRPKSVTNADVADFRRLFEVPNARLPKLGTEPTPPEPDPGPTGRPQVPARAGQAA